MEEEVKRVQFYYGLVLVRTKRFRSLMDQLGRRRISKPIGWAFLYILPVIAAIGLYIFLSLFVLYLSLPAAQVGVSLRGVTPLAFIGLPGVNPYIPIVDGWIALLVAMIVHEGAHGIVARSLGLPVKSSGLVFLLFLPIGAFVDVDEQAISVASDRDAGRVLAAGAGTNFVVAMVALGLLFAAVSTMTPLTNGLAVSQVAIPSPAATAGIMPGDFVKAVNGIGYNDSAQLSNAEVSGKLAPNQVVTITVWRAGVIKQLSNVTLAGNPGNSSRAYIGITSGGSDYLSSLVQQYTGSLLTRPILYFCIPTFPQCQGEVPFSGSNAVFYSSPFGAQVAPLATLLYWIFFLNLNLALFNSLPLGPLDGGQAFRLGVKFIGRGKLSEEWLTRINTITALAIIIVIFGFPAAAYLHLI
ncbi:MAG TPA: site-2 protease family protein [Nitrososphaerales archaeon]|nr:site-2 protease family protein [Nitrososphaerales archaeon]